MFPDLCRFMGKYINTLLLMVPDHVCKAGEYASDGANPTMCPVNV